MSVSDAVDALRATWQAALIDAELLHDPARASDVRVFDGPDARRQMAAKSVTVAAAFEDDQDAVSVSGDERGAGLRVVESIDVASSIYVGSGDIGIDAHRAEASQVLAVLEAALAANRTLGGTVASARIASSQWLQGRDEQGAGVAIGLVVNLRRLP